MIHRIVHGSSEAFCGWPANNGVWSWDDDEILVGFTRGAFKEAEGHNVIPPFESLLARSTDGGECWCIEAPVPYVGRQDKFRVLEQPCNFAANDVAVRVTGNGYHGNTSSEGGFYVSDDRGYHWRGPFAFTGLNADPELAGLEFTPRTDVILESSDSALFVLSARPEGDWAREKVFCAETRDGGKTFQFLSWIVPKDDPFRAVMPSTAQTGAGEFVSVMRRREMGADRCWIDCYASTDHCQSWTLQSTVGVTGPENGNPPALVLTDKGELCCAYGDRANNRMLAQFSGDGGMSWEEPIVLRDDFHEDRFGDSDLGYPRIVQRRNGEILVFYYWSTQANFQHHIALTTFTRD